MKIKQLKSAILLISLISLPTLALAINQAAAQQTPSPVTSITSVNDIFNIADKIANWIFAFFFVIAIVFIIMAAFTYLGSAGDPEKVKTASNQLIYAAVGIAVALIAKSLVWIVRNLLTG